MIELDLNILLQLRNGKGWLPIKELDWQPTPDLLSALGCQGCGNIRFLAERGMPRNQPFYKEGRHTYVWYPTYCPIIGFDDTCYIGNYHLGYAYGSEIIQLNDYLQRQHQCVQNFVINLKLQPNPDDWRIIFGMSDK
jgi:hypothetical protein